MNKHFIDVWMIKKNLSKTNLDEALKNIIRVKLMGIHKNTILFCTNKKHKKIKWQTSLNLRKNQWMVMNKSITHGEGVSLSNPAIWFFKKREIDKQGSKDIYFRFSNLSCKIRGGKIRIDAFGSRYLLDIIRWTLVIQPNDRDTELLLHNPTKI